MKLNFLFLLMDLVTLLAYPIVFVHGRLFSIFENNEVVNDRLSRTAKMIQRQLL